MGGECGSPFFFFFSRLPLFHLALFLTPPFVSPGVVSFDGVIKVSKEMGGILRQVLGLGTGACTSGTNLLV